MCAQLGKCIIVLGLAEIKKKKQKQFNDSETQNEQKKNKKIVRALA